MDKTTSNVNMFQKVLDNDCEVRSEYVNAENQSEDDSEESEACKIIIPTRPKKKYTDTSQELLFQLLKQNQMLSNAQKKMYKLQAELDKEEIITRYIKLDLNNSQVKLEETHVNLKVYKKKFSDARIENWIVRCLVVLYIIFLIFFKNRT
jgi:hypothetical protein